MNLISRSVWKAKAPTGGYTRVNSTRGVKVHYTGGMVPPGIVDDHSICVDLVQQIQRMHMAGGREVPYMDIGYNLVACPHRKVFMGRGPHHLPAANGPGLNSGHYAVLALVGNKGCTQPNDDLLHGIRDAIEYLRKEGNAGSEIKGHRDGYATDCPGGPLYAWVKKGAPRPASKPAEEPKPKPADPDDNPVPEFKGALRLTSPMTHSDAVKVWQQGARRFVPALAVDGWYGPDSKQACEAIQRKVGMPVTGVVDAETWLITWVWEPDTKEKS